MAKKKKTGPAKGIPRPSTLPPPPPGTYDRSLDYLKGAANRGYEQFGNDAQTQFEHGQQLYGLDLGDLTRGRDRTLADIATGRTRENENYNVATQDLGRQYTILGHQQAQSARQHGIRSAGLLGISQQRRAANQTHDQSAIDLAHTRTLGDLTTNETRANEDFTNSKQRLDLGNAYQFGGFNGQEIVNPLTGQPEVGSLTTSLTRAGIENNAYQQGLLGQMIDQAKANGYVAPGPGPAGQFAFNQQRAATLRRQKAAQKAAQGAVMH